MNAEYVYASPANIPFRDITSGSNGYPASTGYDLATGLGAWSYTPGAPTGLTTTSASGGVTLSWSAPSGAPTTEYTIWRGTASGEETTDIATVGVPTMTYTDTSATGGRHLLLRGPGQRTARGRPVLQRGIREGHGDPPTPSPSTPTAVRDDGRRDRQRPDGADAERLHPARLQLLGLEHRCQRLGHRLPRRRHLPLHDERHALRPVDEKPLTPSPSTPTADPGRWPPRPTTPRRR